MGAKITIAKPCHENWNKMTPENQGRHCAVCCKVVKDFTGKKTEDIIHTLKNTEGEVCGRIGVQHLTPANKKQKIVFWAHGVFYRKAMYPLLAFLGVGFFIKKVNAQTGEPYRMKGKIDVNHYHTQSKKITLVVKSAYNEPIAGASITFISGLNRKQGPVVTDINGRVSLLVDAADITAREVAMEILAPGYELKKMVVEVVKDIQTVEIKMDSELMMLGQMMVYPVEQNEEPIMDTPKVKEIEIKACSQDTLKELPLAHENEWLMYAVEPVLPITEDEAGNKQVIDSFVTQPPTYGNDLVVQFDLFPNPANSQVSIVTKDEKNFNMDIFDANGKKIHSIIHVHQRYVLDVSNYATGVYYVLITMEGKAIETKKLVIAR